KKLVVYLPGKDKKGQPIRDEKYRFTDWAEVPKTKLTGVDLLQKSLKVDKIIGDYLEEVVSARPAEWRVREFEKTLFGYRRVAAASGIPSVVAGMGPVANKVGDENLQFQSFDAFSK